MDSLSSVPADTLEQRPEAKRILEALLFATNDPIPLAKIQPILAEVYPVKPRELLELMRELQAEYDTQQRSFELVEVAEGYALRTRRAYAPYIAQLFQAKAPDRLSQAASETLAIVAYRGPVTRSQVEALRGVDSSGVMQSLLERNLIAASGRLNAPGKPTLYDVTPAFLSHFGFASTEALRAPRKGGEIPL